MTTAEERLKILKMIQEGKITAEEGAKLLKALTASGQKPRRPPTARTAGKGRAIDQCQNSNRCA